MIEKESSKTKSQTEKEKWRKGNNKIRRNLKIIRKKTESEKATTIPFPIYPFFIILKTAIILCFS